MWIKDLIEVIFSLGLFINAVLFLPQALKVYRNKDAGELSLITFGGFNLIQFFTFLHGYLHQDYILMAGNLLSLLMCGVVTFMVIFYKKTN